MKHRYQATGETPHLGWRTEMVRKFGIRMGLCAASALGLMVAHAADTRPTRPPEIIGQDRPVFLGRMTIVATPLPAATVRMHDGRWGS